MSTRRYFTRSRFIAPSKLTVVTYRCHHNIDSESALSKRELRAFANVVPGETQHIYHVITRIGGGWSVHKEGAQRSTAIFNCKEQAVKHARDAARSAGGELVVHRRDGLIQELTIYPSRRASGKGKRR